MAGYSRFNQPISNGRWQGIPGSISPSLTADGRVFPRPVVLIICTGHATTSTRRHFVLVTARGLSRRTLKTITHHLQPHTESTKSVRSHRPKPITIYMLPLLLKTKWRAWPDSQQPNWSRNQSLYTGHGYSRLNQPISNSRWQGILGSISPSLTADGRVFQAQSAHL